MKTAETARRGSTMKTAWALAAGILVSVGALSPAAHAAGQHRTRNPHYQQALDEGKVATTPTTARSWHERENVRRQLQQRAAAKRQQQVTRELADDSRKPRK